MSEIGMKKRPSFKYIKDHPKSMLAILKYVHFMEQGQPQHLLIDFRFEFDLFITIH